MTAPWPATWGIRHDHVQELHDAINLRLNLLGLTPPWLGCSWGTGLLESAGPVFPPIEGKHLEGDLIYNYGTAISWLAKFFCRYPVADTFEAYTAATLGFDVHGNNAFWHCLADGVALPGRRSRGESQADQWRDALHFDYDLNDLKAAVDRLRYPWANLSDLGTVAKVPPVPGYDYFHMLSQAYRWSDWSWARAVARTPYWKEARIDWLGGTSHSPNAPSPPCVIGGVDGYSGPGYIGRGVYGLSVTDPVEAVALNWPSSIIGRLFASGSARRVGFTSGDPWPIPGFRPLVVASGSTWRGNAADAWDAYSGVAIIPAATNEVPDGITAYRGTFEHASNMSCGKYFKVAFMGDMSAPSPPGGLTARFDCLKVVWLNWDLSLVPYTPPTMVGTPTNIVPEIPPDPEHPDDPYDPPEDEEHDDDPYDPYYPPGEPYDPPEEPYVPGGPFPIW